MAERIVVYDYYDIEYIIEDDKMSEHSLHRGHAYYFTTGDINTLTNEVQCSCVIDECNKRHYEYHKFIISITSTSLHIGCRRFQGENRKKVLAFLHQNPDFKEINND